MLRTTDAGDRAGIGLAIACAVHCVAAPIVAASFQAAAALVSERTELLFLSASLVVSGATITTNCVVRRGRPATLVLFTLGAMTLMVARGSLVPAESERLLVLGGAGTIVAAHILNLLTCRCADEGSTCAAVE
jgi:hypothetical protein